MFDRGLVTLEDDYKIVVASKLVPNEAQRLLVPDLMALVPPEISSKPHPGFLAYHREFIFKG
jgi:putative restriction endonuclease